MLSDLVFLSGLSPDFIWAQPYKNKKQHPENRAQLVKLQGRFSHEHMLCKEIENMPAPLIMQATSHQCMRESGVFSELWIPALETVS